MFDFIFNNNSKSFNKKISEFNQAKRKDMVKKIGTSPDSSFLKNLKNLSKVVSSHPKL